MLNAAALVSGDGAELQSLLDSVFFGEIEGFSLAAVISTERGSFALTRAEGAHVPGYVVEEAIFPNGASFSLALLNKLHDLDIDFIILAGFAPKLSEGLARAYRGRAVGVRCALSPPSTLCAPRPLPRRHRPRRPLDGRHHLRPGRERRVGEILLSPRGGARGRHARHLRRRVIETAGPLLIEAIKAKAK
ncbi:MAG: formyltransferase family protein [Oscillospiraceae bacterium]